MQYLLAGALLLAAGVSRSEEGPIRVGMTIDQVDNVLGRPSGSFSFGNFGSGGTISYLREDWLGGHEGWTVFIGPDDRVTYYEVKYHPFAGTPPWLECVRSALTPAGK